MTQHSEFQSRVASTFFRLLAAFLPAVILVTGGGYAGAQELPKTIRGYRVHNQVIRLTSTAPAAPERPYLAIARPTVSDISLFGLSFAIAGELGDAGHEGRVEMLTFHDFRVNGLEVAVSDYNTPFEIKKSGKTKLPAAADVLLPIPNVLNAAWNELLGSKKDWSVTGRVFVFGNFKRFGFHFRRVIPVDLDMVIENPLIEYRKTVLSAIPASRA